jgi:homoserine dehydrogenase
LKGPKEKGTMGEPAPRALAGSAVERVLIGVAGLGHVGKAFVGLVQDKADSLRTRFGLDLKFWALLKSDGGLISDSGISLEDLAGLDQSRLTLSPLWKTGLGVEDVLPRSGPGVFVDCTPSNIQTGEPGLAYIRTALKAGWHVVTAGKGPLVADFEGLRGLARDNHLGLGFSAATAAALPALDIGVHSLAGADVLSIEGILNGTSNFILTQMGEGAPYEVALKLAQVRGIAEPNPALDVGGWDTAVKLLLIANSVLGLGLTRGDVQVEGITGVRPEDLTQARRKGRAIKLIGRIRREGDRWRAEVGPVSIDRTHPLFGVEGTNKGITFETDTMGSVTVSGGKSDPRGAAAALLKDIIHVFRK